METGTEKDTDLVALRQRVAELEAALAAGGQTTEAYRMLVESSFDHVFMLNRQGIYVASNDRTGQLGFQHGTELLGKHLREVYPSKVAAHYEERLAQVLTSGQVVHFEHPLPSEGTPYTHVDTLYPIYQDGQVWAVGGICHDVTVQRQAEQAQERRTSELSALNAIAAVSSSSLDLDEILTGALDKLRKLTEVEACAIYVWDHEPGALSLAAQRGVDASWLDQVRMLPDVGERMAQAIAAGVPFVVSDLAQEPGVPKAALEIGGFHSAASLPLNARSGAQGIMVVAGRAPGTFAADEVRLYAAIAAQIGIAVENATLYEAARRELAERRRAEDALRRTYEAVQAGVVVQAADGRILHANQVACTIFGMASGAIQGRTSLDPGWQMVHEDGTPVPGEEHPSMITLRTGQPLRDVVRGLFAEQPERLRWLSISTEPLHDPESGALREVIITLYDITDRKQAEKALHESEARYRELFDAMSSGVAVYQAVEDGADFVLLDFNRAGQQIEQIDRGKVVGRRVTEVFPGIRDLGLLNVLQEVWRTGRPVRLTRRPYRDQRIEGWRENYVYRLPSGEVVAVYDDITERVQAEISLLQSEARYRELYDKAPVGYHELSREGTIVRVNRTEADMLGYTVEEIVGQPAWAFLVPEQRALSQETIRGKVSGEIPLAGFRRRFLHKDGREIDVYLQERPIVDEQGVIVGLRVTLQDITAQVEAERQLQASLAEKVVLLQEVHHRVKNNLQIVASLLDLQAEEISDPRALQAFRDSQDRIRSMALVHDSLYRSQDLAHIGMVEYVRGEVANLATAYGLPGVEVRTQVDEGLFLGIDVAVPCGLIINELVSNALKHAFPFHQERWSGLVEVELRALDGPREADGTTRLCLAVRDDGVGLPLHIDLQELPSLGLRLVSILTAQIRGTLEIERGGGTRFAITFPSRLP